jgi:UDP-hydrolysing UDP-N-acetyl-D-glucosamine 2-epimerase
MTNKKKKVCVVITARPSYSRIRTALTAIEKHPNLELVLVLAASALLDRYGSAVEFVERDGFTIHERVYMVLEGNSPTSMAKTTGLGIMELATAFDNINPDMVVTIADRYETMATAIAASYMNIPLVHIQGGEVTGNIDEKVRHAISKLSDLHLVSTLESRERLIKMGEEPGSVEITGCPSIDLAKEVLEDPKIDFDIISKYGGVGANIDLTKDYLVVLQHPVTTEFKDSKLQIEQTLKAIHKLNMQCFWFWPNVDAGSDGVSSGIRSFREETPINKIHFFKNMDGKDFLKLIYNSKCLIGNSSVGIRESAYLGVPVVNIGSRQNRRERGNNVIDCDYDELAIRNAIEIQKSKGGYKQSEIYGGGDAGEKIAEALAAASINIKKVITY